mgnify:CR=1 FL=1
MTKKIISTDKAPAAIGPYSQAVRSGDLLFISGQIPLDPASGDVVSLDFSMQVIQVLDNFEAVLQAAGVGWGEVVKTTVYLTDLGRFAEFNALYAKRFTSEPPARAVVQVSALPKGVQVEMEGIVGLKPYKAVYIS